MQIDVIEIGDTLIDIQKRSFYRVILIKEEFIEVCKLKTTALDLTFISLEEMREKIISKEIVVEKQDSNVVDLSLMSDTERQKFEISKQIINEISQVYGPTYEGLRGRQRKKDIIKISEKYNLSKESIRRLYIRYIQAGCREYGLLDARYTSNREQKRKEYEYSIRTGNKTDDAPNLIIVTHEIKEQFDEAIKYFKSGRVKTYEAAYEWMCMRYYTYTSFSNGKIVTLSLPLVEIPTIRQFRYYIHKELTQQEIDVIKTSKREQRNNKRLLVGDSLYDVMGPGDLVEMDAVEIDVSLVSESDRTKTVGRPIVYIMIDVYTRMIIAMSISYDNNSEIALTNCFLNLGDDKEEYCKKFGITITRDMWISNIIPRRIRCDRGADFRSKSFKRICKNLGIDRQLVSAAIGSLKGTVEQVFRQMHSAQNIHLENKGFIEKRYNSNHHKQAMLTITEYTKILLTYVLTHNAQAIEKYPLTREMIEHDIQNKPLNLWKYGCKKYGEPRPITNRNQFIYELLVPSKASLDRKGIRVNGLYYMNWQDEKLRSQMYKQQNKVMDIDVRYDPRDVGQIYYLRNGELKIAGLNAQLTGNAEYAGLTYKELKEYQSKMRKIKNDTKKQKQVVKNNRFLINQSITDKVATDQVTYASSKNLRENREAEKQLVSQKNNVLEHIEYKQAILPDELKKEKQDEKVNELTTNNFTGALDEFEE